jgi:hypothetical protein
MTKWLLFWKGCGIKNCRICIVLLAIVLLFSCSTTRNFERYAGTWIGEDIKRLQNAWGAPDQDITLPNGNTEYAYNTTKRYGLTLPDACVVYWEVDKQSQKIIRMRHEGTRCKRAPSCV